MSIFRFIHAADLHLDSAFEAMGDKAAQRRRELRELPGKIVAIAEHRGAQAIVLSGDLLDTTRAYPETVAALREAFASTSLPIFIAPGNHDYYCAASPYAREQFSENVHIFNSQDWQCVELDGARIWGAAFTDSASGGLLRGFSVKKVPGIADICVVHGDVGSADSSYGPISAADIAACGADYVALGHVHTASGLKREGRTWYAYPGCAEGRGFDECGEKGVLDVIVSDNGVCTAEFVPTALRKYQVVSMPWYDMSLPENAGADIYRIILTGERDTAPNLYGLQRALQDNFCHLELVDATVPTTDVWAAAEQDTLRGAFLRRMRAMLDAASSDEEREKINQAVRWGIAAIDGGEAVAEV